MSVNLRTIEGKLNSDPAYQREFLRDPVDLLKREGLELTDSMADNLRRFVGNLSGAQQGVAGSNLGANPQEVGIGISIGKSF